MQMTQFFLWIFLSRCHSGGLLLGANQDLVEIKYVDQGEFYTSVVMEMELGKAIWELINVYGPVQEELTQFFFNLVGDALSELLMWVKEVGHLKGLIPHLFQGGLTHLQYVDDTILFMDFFEQNFITMKFLLYCYEEMSGM
ncbi:hypothetical protein GUJ93_ZPchr0013g34415 [Zizania palustris]|uniref:Reverse transcriptase domain-containing protein n=1 Tax=Zizania palustris TaxID=103762 RepID=A0A8J6C0N0_ZIZPA|nr:hypothetical protein GUJ93_ZPchr0013g34415 [Zizania palustris]